MIKNRNRIYTYYMVLPGLIIYIIFFILPSLSGLVLSFMNVTNFKFSDMTFAGLENYKNVFTNAHLRIAIKNSFIFSFVTTALKVTFGFLLALMLNRNLKTKNYLRTVFFLPVILNNVAVGLIFTAVLHPTTGMVNKFLQFIHLEVLAQHWLTNSKIAIYSVSFIEVWKWTGFIMIILLAGLQSISKEYYEAAELDGATCFQKFRYVTFPLVLPYFKNSLVISIIGGLKVFELVQAVTQGGPGYATEVFGTLVFKAFGNGRYGEGSAANILLALIVLIIALPINRMIERREVEA